MLRDREPATRLYGTLGAIVRRASVQAYVARELSYGPAAPVRAGRWKRPHIGLGTGISFGMGFALAACLALACVLPTGGDGSAEAVVTDHIRSLPPGHLIDVVPSDQHTTKPWFNGRLAFAPYVKNLEAEGFPLAGERLDYLGGREVAALIRRNRQYVIELFAGPSGSDLDREPAQGSRNGYNFARLWRPR